MKLAVGLFLLQAAITKVKGADDGGSNSLSVPLVNHCGMTDPGNFAFGEPTMVDGEEVWLQKDNTWHTKMLETGGFDAIDVGDLLTAIQPTKGKLAKKIRIEFTLLSMEEPDYTGQNDDPYLAWEMVHVSGSGIDEVWGTTKERAKGHELERDTTLPSSYKSLYCTSDARLSIRRVDQETGYDPEHPEDLELGIFDSYSGMYEDDPEDLYELIAEPVTSEITVSGKTTHGYNWDRKAITTAGSYRLLFYITGNENLIDENTILDVFDIDTVRRRHLEDATNEVMRIVGNTGYAVAIDVPLGDIKESGGGGGPGGGGPGGGQTGGGGGGGKPAKGNKKGGLRRRLPSHEAPAGNPSDGLNGLDGQVLDAKAKQKVDQLFGQCQKKKWIGYCIKTVFDKLVKQKILQEEDFCKVIYNAHPSKYCCGCRGGGHDDEGGADHDSGDSCGGDHEELL